MEHLTNHFIISLYMLLFGEEKSCMSLGEMEEISKIIDWFPSLGNNFLSVFNEEKSSHVLPRYAIDNLVMHEVSYHLAKLNYTILRT